MMCTISQDNKCVYIMPNLMCFCDSPDLVSCAFSAIHILSLVIHRIFDLLDYVAITIYVTSTVHIDIHVLDSSGSKNCTEAY